MYATLVHRAADRLSTSINSSSCATRSTVGSAAAAAAAVAANDWRIVVVVATVTTFSLPLRTRPFQLSTTSTSVAMMELRSDGGTTEEWGGWWEDCG
jgi:hypothetical protein